MPRRPTNYKNTLIYKIVCKDTSIEDLYVGHTTSFKDRKREHKSRCNCNYSRKIYKTINDNGGWDNWEMIEIEKFPCDNSTEAKKRERYWYEKLNSKLNVRNPIVINYKEYRHLYNISENRIEYMKNYNKNLTEKQKQNKNEYSKKWKSQPYTCECGAIILNACKNKHFKTPKHIKNKSAIIIQQFFKKYASGSD